jgi:hypothetical protein
MRLDGLSVLVVPFSIVVKSSCGCDVTKASVQLVLCYLLLSWGQVSGAELRLFQYVSQIST